MTQHNANHHVSLLTFIQCLTLPFINSERLQSVFGKHSTKLLNCLFSLTKTKRLLFCDFCHENIYDTNKKLYIKKYF